MRFYLLGHLRIEQGDEHVATSALPRLRKTQGLLAYLLLRHDQPTTREQMASLFWGDMPEDRARDSLSTALTQIRVMMADTEIVLQADRNQARLIFGKSTWLDVDVVRRGLAQNATGEERIDALRIYTAELLTGWSDEWCIEEREQLRTRMLRLGAATLQRYQHQGMWAEGYALSEQLLLHDPLDETLHEMAVRSLLGLNDYAGARRHYQQFASLLRSELDADPGTTLSTLYEATLRGSATAMPYALSVESAQAPSGVQRLPFVGREKEQGILKNALATLFADSAIGSDRATHRKSIVLVEGEAGIGKTRLVDETLADFAGAGRKLNIIRSKASEAGKDLPFGPLLAPLGRWLLGDLAPAQVLQRLGSAVIANLAQIMPALASRFPNLPSLPPLPADTAHTRLVQSLLETLQRMGTAQSPVILFLDDLQWADASTIQVLDQLRALHSAHPDLPLLVIGTYRGDETASYTLLADLAEKLSHDEGSVLHIKPLRRADVQQAVEKRMPADHARLSDWLFEQSDGNAFYLTELLQGLREDGRVVPDGTVGGWKIAEGAYLPATSSSFALPKVENAIVRRFSNLSAATQNLVRVIAILGEAGSFPIIASAGGWSEDAALSGLEEAMSRRFVRWSAQSDRYGIAHDLVREALVKALSPARKQHLHLAVAQALERDLDTLATQPSQPPDLSALLRLAYHYGETAQFGKQHYYFNKVAKVALTGFSNDLALDYYKRLLLISQPEERVEILLRMARLLNIMVKPVELDDVCRQAVSLAETTGNRTLIARARVELGRSLWLATRYNESFNQCNLALDLIRHIPSPDPALLVRVYYVLGENHYMVQNYSDAIQQFERALELLDGLSDETTRCIILVRLGDIYAHLQQFEQALYYYRYGLEISRERGDLQSTARALYGIGYYYNMQEDAPQAIPLMVEAWQIGALTGYKAMRTPVFSVLTSCYLAYGEYEKAYACGAAHLQLALSVGNYYAATIALTNLGSIEAGLGNYESADLCWQHSLQLVSKTEIVSEAADCLRKMAVSQVKRGNYGVALTQAEEAIERARQARVIEIECDLRLLRIIACFGLGKLSVGDATSECEALLPLFHQETEQASILYTVWLLDPTQEEARAKAEVMYSALCAARPTVVFREKYHKLSGEHWPAPLSLPELPDFVSALPPKLPELLRLVDDASHDKTS